MTIIRVNKIPILKTKDGKNIKFGQLIEFQNEFVKLKNTNQLNKLIAKYKLVKLYK